MVEEDQLCYSKPPEIGDLNSQPNLQFVTCERNWSLFERIHSKKRNRLENQRLNDLVYVHYNLRLKMRNRTKNTFYDPIDFDAIDLIEDLVVDDEPDKIVEAIVADVTIPIFENQTQRTMIYHKQAEVFD